MVLVRYNIKYGLKVAPIVQLLRFTGDFRHFVIRKVVILNYHGLSLYCN